MDRGGLDESDRDRDLDRLLGGLELGGGSIRFVVAVITAERRDNCVDVQQAA